MAGIKVSPANVPAEVNRAPFSVDFARASGHYNGKGMEEGIRINATTAFLRNSENDKMFGDKCLLETIIIAAATWPSERISAIH